MVEGRSPNMRHVSRTHRVVLEWLFDRISLETDIQGIDVNTAQHIADVLTKGSFSQERWTRLAHLFGFLAHQTRSCSFSVVLHLVSTETYRSDQERCQLRKFRQKQNHSVDVVYKKRKDVSEACRELVRNEENPCDAAWRHPMRPHPSPNTVRKEDRDKDPTSDHNFGKPSAIHFITARKK